MLLTLCSKLVSASVLFIALLMPLWLCAANSEDAHLNIDPAAPIYKQSVFLHGYAHGYELGFHSGDLDLHMGRVSRDPRSIKMFKDSKKVYRKDFGNRDMFVSGYEQGFRVGYADAFSGKDFRAAQELRTLSQQIQDTPAPVDTSRHVSGNSDFDKGVAEGYKTGMTTGLGDARANNAYRPANPRCPRKNNAGQFCPAHRLGYELGYSDGYNNQRKPEEAIKTASE